MQVSMSCEHTQRFLENKFEEGLAKGMTEQQAEKYAYDCLEQCP